MTQATFEHVKKKSPWTETVFYVAEAALLIAVFCYLALSAKVFFQQRKLGQIQAEIDASSTQEQRDKEKQVFEYKQKIDTFASLLAGHKLSSNVFTFLEKVTLPNVWFSSLALSQETNDMKLVGEAASLEVFSRQIELFESNAEYVKNINVIDSKVASSGKVSFIINVSLYPVIFENAIAHGN